MDLSIYAPDTSSAPYGDPLSINMGEDVGMTMGNLSTLDINSCAPYMENNDYYTLNHFEPVPMNNNMGHDNHQVYVNPQSINPSMDGTANYSNDPLQQQQPQPQQQLQHQVLNPGAVEVNNQLLSTSTTTEWPANSGMTIAATTPVIPPIQEVPTTDELNKSSTEMVITGLPVLKIKVKGGTYVVNSTNNPVANESKEEPKSTAGDQQVVESKEKEKTKDKLKEKKKEKEKKSSSSSSKSKEESSSSSSSSKLSDSKRRDKERERSKSSLSSSKDGKSSSSSSSGKDKSKSSKPVDTSRREKPKVKGSPRSESQSKEAKQAEKNRETLAAIKAMAMTPVVKMAKIPRKKVEDLTASSSDTAATTVTDVLDKLAPRPKTVKTFNSKFRSTGLVEEPGKSPPIANRKAGAASPSSAVDKKSPSVKRSGSIDGLTPPADKKMKAVDDTAISAAVAAVMKKTAADIKPAVKLISPRPRRKFSFLYYFWLSHI